MIVYEFAVLGPDQTVLQRSMVELESCGAAWAQVAALAWKLGEISGLIRVTDAEGALVILTGVCSARRASTRPVIPTSAAIQAPRRVATAGSARSRR